MDDLSNEVIFACKTITKFLLETANETAAITFLGVFKTYGPEGEQVYTPIALDMMMLRNNRKEGVSGKVSQDSNRVQA